MPADATSVPEPPHPYSPYATADPAYKHLLMHPTTPTVGSLALTSCTQFAVAPAGRLREVQPTAALSTADPDPNLCPRCLAQARGESRLRGPFTQTRCGECGGTSITGQWCGPCRVRLHELWWTEQAAQMRAEWRRSLPTAMWERIGGVTGGCPACAEAERSWLSGARIDLVTIHPARDGGLAVSVCPVCDSGGLDAPDYLTKGHRS